MPDEAPYTNRELRKIHEDMADKIEKVLDQVKLTNGNVRKLWMVVIAIVFLLLGLGFNQLGAILALL